MKHFVVLAGLAILGCSSSPEPESKPAAAGPAANPREQQISALRASIAAKRAELAQTEADLAKVSAEREQLSAQPASNEKTNRLIELGRLETESNQKKTTINADLQAYQSQLAELTGTAKPKSADDALDMALEADAKKDKEAAERRKQQEESARAEEARKLAEAERARIAEEQARAKEKIEGGRAAEGAEGGPGFDERWADVISKIRAELQRYKRW
jgi:dTMP kinase